jgi:hypothetical protein
MFAQDFLVNLQWSEVSTIGLAKEPRSAWKMNNDHVSDCLLCCCFFPGTERIKKRDKTCEFC